MKPGTYAVVGDSLLDILEALRWAHGGGLEHGGSVLAVKLLLVNLTGRIMQTSAG